MPSKSWAQIDSSRHLIPKFINGNYCYDSAGIIGVANIKKDLKSIQSQKEALETLLEISDVDQKIHQDEIKRLEDLENKSKKELIKLSRKSFWKGFKWGSGSTVVVGVLLLLLLNLITSTTTATSSTIARAISLNYSSFNNT